MVDEKEDLEDLDDYLEDEQTSFNNQRMGKDLSDVSYEDFNKVREEEKTTTHTQKKKVTTVQKTVKKKEEPVIENDLFVELLSFIWTFFRWIGIAIAIILIIYFLVKGMFGYLFLYLLALVLAFFFGFGFMAIIYNVMN